MEKKEANKVPKPNKLTPRQKGFKKSVSVKKPKENISKISKTLFKIKKIETPIIPEFKNKAEIDVRYPLIKPYVNVHIHFSKEKKTLLYEVEEPELNEKEKKLLKILESGLEELISLSFLAIKTEEAVIEYLEKSIKILLNELNINVNKETFLKLMYYIYRNFVGLNEIEPLMRDYYIEDIECNGLNSPIYLVHRKYRNIRTNVRFRDMKYLTSFVEKLAQKAGKYISYASPTLDGRLPGGSRVNATYTEEISTKGPTFTIRKFTAEPWTPIKLIEFKTVSPEMLAYLWLLVEHESNIMVIGGTGSGKTTLLNAMAFFIPPASRVVSIEDSVTGDSKIIIKKNDKIKNISIKKFVDNKIDAEVMTLNDKGKIIFVKPSDYIKHKVKKDIYEVLTSTGRKIKVTKDHSLFSLGEDGLLKEVKPIDLKEKKSFIAVPRILPISGNIVKEINLMKHLKWFKSDFLVGEPIKKIFEDYFYKQLKVAKERYVWWKRHNLIKIEEFLKLNIKFSYEELQELKIKSKNTSSIPVLFEINKEFLEFCGLWLGDGSYDNYNKNSIILSNSDEECRDLFKRIAKYLDCNYSKMSDGGVSLRLHSTIFYKFMKNVLKFDGYSSTKKIPNFIFNLANEQIKHFIRGYFSADGCVKKSEVSCSSQSYELLSVLQSLFLRLNIISRINDFDRKDKCINMSISSFENIDKFKEIQFLQERKNEKLNLLDKRAHHTCSDVIPLSTLKLQRLNEIGNVKLQYGYLKGLQNIGRDYIQKIAPIGSEFNDISHNDILWDKVKKVKKISSKEVEVFDLSIPKYEKFLCNNIFVHNTRELNLLHENWLPSVSRKGLGIGTQAGYGEVSLFDLLKESFRQRPDYVIVGEVRGKEASVLFQGMSSGHPSFGTMHAEDVQTMVRRLETPPIELSPSLVQSLDAVCIMTQAKVGGKATRRVREVAEIIGVTERLGEVQTNTPFIWDPRGDRFYFKLQSHVLNKVVTKSGLTQQQLFAEFRLRARLLMAMYQNKITNYKEVYEIIHGYYRNPKETLAKFNIS